MTTQNNKTRIQLVNDYDPRPPKFQGTASERMPELLKAIRGDHIYMSLMFDEVLPLECRRNSISYSQYTYRCQSTCTCNQKSLNA